MLRTWIEAFSTVGEFAIAAVIYFEIEAHRASTFLADVQSQDFYDDRRELYKAYVNAAPASATLKERAERFKDLLWQDETLRAKCDRQWTNIFRLRYALRWSVYRGEVSRWFPQVLVSLWVMTGLYQREREELRPFTILDYGILAARESLRVLKKRTRRSGLKPITIYASPGQKVIISKDVLEQMMKDLDAPFK
jgi:hypothetical protein